MTYELWISPQTGYRRRGTSAAELRVLFENGITVHSISEPLRCCLTTDLAQDVRAELERLDFDVAGVLDRENMRVTGWVSKELLPSGICADCMTPFQPFELIAESTPIAEVISLLADAERAYVVERRGVSGIVTRADLQKPPVRTVLFGLITLLDMHLTYWIAQLYPGTDWKKCLSTPRLAKIRDLHQSRVRRNEEVSELECLQMADKRTIIARDRMARDILGFKTKRQAETTLRAIEGLRDRVAHSQSDLTAARGWSEVAELLGSIAMLLQASDIALGARASAAAGAPPTLVPVA